MLKQLVVKLYHKDKEFTVELGMKGDGITTVHAYENKSGTEYVGGVVQLFMKNEEGNKAMISQDLIEKDSYPRMLEEWKDVHNWEFKGDYSESRNYFQEGTAGRKKYDDNKQFLIEGLGTPGKIIGQDRADELTRDWLAEHGYGDLNVEDSEINELGYVYTLSDGSSLVVKGNGSIERIVE